MKYISTGISMEKYMENKSELLIYQTPDGVTKIETRLQDETVWLTQAQLCELFQKSKLTISEHIKHIFEEGEFNENSVVRNFRTTANDGIPLLYITCFALSEYSPF